MTDREKLIELLQHDNCPLFMVFGDKVDVLADYLIANGVTVQKWIPVTERLPEKGEIVLACGKKHATTGMFQGTLRNIPERWHWKGNTLKVVTHWMPLPEQPKEVE